MRLFRRKKEVSEIGRLVNLHTETGTGWIKYLNFDELKNLLEEILKTNTTTEYVRAIPHYAPETENGGELEFYRFFITLDPEFNKESDEERYDFWTKYQGKKREDITTDEKYMLKKLLPKFSGNSLEGFQAGITAFIDYFDEFKEMLTLEAMDLFGYKREEIDMDCIEFEVHWQ